MINGEKLLLVIAAYKEYAAILEKKLAELKA